MSRSDVLVDADWVEAHLGDPSVVIVEVDEDTSAYDTGHIEGAVKIEYGRPAHHHVISINPIRVGYRWGTDLRPLS